jgi:UDP-galactose transporter B1
LIASPRTSVSFFLPVLFHSNKEQPEMARTKQATPLRREVSDEYFSRREVATPRRKTSNGAAVVPEAKAKEAKVEKREAGALELAIAVGGIYASL